MDIPPRGVNFPPDFNIFWVHQADQVFHNNIDTIFMKVTMIAETEQIQFQGFTLHHAFTGNV